MKAKTPKPTPAHMQKLADLMDTRPEGVTARQVQNTLSVSPTLAKAALIEIGATEVDGKWVFADEVEQSGNAGELEPVALAPEPLKKLTHPAIDWSAAPEGATHWHDGEWIRWTGKKDMNLWNLDAWDDGCRWTESAYGFHGTLDDFLADGAIPRPEPDFDMGECGIQNFQKECQRVTEQQAKSDFAVALEAERQRVFDAVEFGGTAARIAERTGIPVDDVQMHLDTLIDDGAIVERPIIVAMSYKVAT